MHSPRLACFTNTISSKYEPSNRNKCIRSSSKVIPQVEGNVMSLEIALCALHFQILILFRFQKTMAGVLEPQLPLSQTLYGKPHFKKLVHCFPKQPPARDILDTFALISNISLTYGWVYMSGVSLSHLWVGVLCLGVSLTYGQVYMSGISLFPCQFGSEPLP